LPNTLSYAKQLAQSHPLGWSVLLTGFDAISLSLIVNICTVTWTIKYLDKHFPEFGGKNDHSGYHELDLSDVESFRRTLRSTIRKSFVFVVTIFTTIPFTVVYIRQMAQVIGGEEKYIGIWQSTQLILTEEGLAGLFSGVIPVLIGTLFGLWAADAVLFASERLLTRSGLRQMRNTTRADWIYKKIRDVIFFCTHFAVVRCMQPYEVVSNVMACAGS
ncbi:hypothetical protein PMAYCL1PPCAC_05403, partial [Pristionchus mayeri]